MARIAVGGFQHETSTLAPGPGEFAWTRLRRGLRLRPPGAACGG